MAGYFGTETQMRLQRQAEESADFIACTPGACQAGRTMGCDDPERFGWERIGDLIQRDGVCGFRLIGIDDLPAIKSELAARNYRFDTWDVFLAEREVAIKSSRVIQAQPLPGRLRIWATPADPESQLVKDTQAMMATAGLVPFSGSMLVGEIGACSDSHRWR